MAGAGAVGAQGAFCWNSVFPADSPFPGLPGSSGTRGAPCQELLRWAGHNPPGQQPGQDPGQGSLGLPSTAEALGAPVVPTANFGETFGGLWGSYPNFGEDVWCLSPVLGRFWGRSVVLIPFWGRFLKVSSQVLGRLRQQPGARLCCQHFPGHCIPGTRPRGTWHGDKDTPGTPGGTEAVTSWGAALGWHRGWVISRGPSQILGRLLGVSRSPIL